MNKTEIINFGIKLGIDSKLIEELLIKITGLSKSQLFLSDNIDDSLVDEIENGFSRLVSGEPIEYIINRAEFYGLDFYVDSRTLVPRDDTEVMVDCLVRDIELVSDDISYIDVGTGTSCIAVSTYLNSNNIGNASVIDISDKALEVSLLNLEKHDLVGKINQYNGDLLEPVLYNNNFLENIVISANLPYIKDGDFNNMDDETIYFEPDLALYGGKETGFELYEKLIDQCLVLKSKGHKVTLYIEIGFDQYDYSNNYLNNLGLNHEYFKDNSNIERCIKIKF